MEESGGRKRKMGNEEDDEEEKVEKFFALIRSTREVRDRLKNVVALPNGSKEDEKVSPAAGGGGGGQWNPTFRPEDFMEDSVSGSKSPLVLNDPSSETKHGPGKERKDGGGEGGGGGGLDLNLSLSL